MGGDICCTPDLWESVCQGVSVLVMGPSRGFSSCDEARLWGWTGNDLFFVWSARLAFGRSRLGRNLGLTPFFFLQRACSKGIRRRICYQGPIACAFMRCRLLVRLRFGVTVLASVSSFALQVSFCNLVAVLFAGGLPESSQYRRSSGPGGLFA